MKPSEPKRNQRDSYRWLILLVMGFLLAACGPSASKRKQNLDDTLSRYASAIRWGDFAGATNFLDPDLDKSKRPTDLDMARYQNLRVSAYVPQPIQPGPDENSIAQNVRISFYNRFTNRERSILDHQVWRYDEEKQRWYLTTGLPKVTHE